MDWRARVRGFVGLLRHPFTSSNARVLPKRIEGVVDAAAMPSLVCHLALGGVARQPLKAPQIPAKQQSNRPWEQKEEGKPQLKGAKVRRPVLHWSLPATRKAKGMLEKVMRPRPSSGPSVAIG
jgi:hypothetical protein